MLASGRDGLPRSLLEAAAYGRAMVATDIPGCREIAIEGETALTVPATMLGRSPMQWHDLQRMRAFASDLAKEHDRLSKKNTQPKRLIGRQSLFMSHLDCASSEGEPIALNLYGSKRWLEFCCGS
jgi:glycosyltransferase involved in cell wall biosynthesis